MKLWTAGQQVPTGLYVAPKALDVRYVGSDNETLQGTENAVYLRIPTLVLLAVAPALGGIFVMAFPFLVLGFTAMVTATVGYKFARQAAQRLVVYASPDWAPSAAYFTRMGKSKKDDR